MFSSFARFIFFCLQACQHKRRKKPEAVRAVGDVVAEICIHTDTVDTSFEVFLQRNRMRISEAIDDERRRHGCVAYDAPVCLSVCHESSYLYSYYRRPMVVAETMCADCQNLFYLCDCTTCVCDCFRSIRVMARTSAVFTRCVDDYVQHVTGHFTSLPQLVTNDGHAFDMDALATGFVADVENFNQRGSSFVLERIADFTLIITRYRPLAASSYIPTPKSIAGKRAVINVHNGDQRCFEYALISALYPPKDHAERVSSYTKYLGTLCFDGIQFPVRVRDIDRFEKLNPDISVNVISLDDDNKGFCIERLSPERQRKRHVTLLLLTDDTKNSHYVWVKNFSRLLGERSKHDGASYVCQSCLNVFSSQRVLDDHVTKCLVHHPQQVVYPSPNNPDKCKLKFRDFDKQHSLTFFLVCDFEAFLSPVDHNDDDNDDEKKTQIDDCDDDSDEDNGDEKKQKRKKTRIVDRHEISGFCCHRVTHLERYQTPPTVYSGEDVIEHFYNHVMTESREIDEILSAQLPLSRMTDDELRRHRSAIVCENCRCDFTHDNPKVRHHDHTTGRYLFPACNSCNLQLKPKKCKVGTGTAYFLPIIFHNLTSYDSHFLLKEFHKRYALHHVRNGKVSYDDVRIIPLSSEKYIQIQIANLKFLDSFNFLPSSLEKLVELLLKGGKEKFKNTTKYLGDSQYIFRKGVYPYAYVTDRSVFDETSLPPVEKFYNTLNDQAVTDEDYRHAQECWKHYDMRSMRDYHDFYLTLDVLLLADVFASFRWNVLDKHGLDCLYFPTLPSLAFSMALKHTEAELDLICDPDMYLMLENSIRGGICTISNRYCDTLLHTFDSTDRFKTSKEVYSLLVSPNSDNILPDIPGGRKVNCFFGRQKNKCEVEVIH